MNFLSRIEIFYLILTQLNVKIEPNVNKLTTF